MGSLENFKIVYKDHGIVCLALFVEEDLIFCLPSAFNNIDVKSDEGGREKGKGGKKRRRKYSLQLCDFFATYPE